MTKKTNVQQGTKITGKQANSNRFIQLNEFLLFDPLYSSMPEKAKLLYSFLKHKLQYFEMQTENHENGMEETKSYRDDEGYIYCIADNTELEYILNCAESTLIRVKKALAEYGLLLEVPTQTGANRLYVLEPAQLTDHWMYIEEIKTLRAKKKELNKEKAAKRTKKVSDLGNLQNESHGNLQNESHGNLQNESKIKSNSFKSNLNSKIKHNQSISTGEKINSLNISDSIKSYLHKNQNRLTDTILNIVQSVFNMNLVTDDSIFIEKLEKTLDTKPQTQAFKSYFTKALNSSKNENTAQPASSTQNKVTRKEIVPTWLTEETDLSDDSSQVTESDSELEMYADLYKTTDCKLDAEIINKLLAKGYLTPEDIKKEIA